jgi:hypothetical protein
MLDPRFKSLHFVSFFIGCEEVNIVKEYDRVPLYPMLLKCYYYLHPMTKSEVECANHREDAKSDLDILKQTPNTGESATELVTKEMLIFRCYQVDSKEMKCLLEWWAKHEIMFITIDFLAQEILRIVGSQIETKRIIFSLAGIFTNLRRSRL